MRAGPGSVGKPVAWSIRMGGLGLPNRRRVRQPPGRSALMWPRWPGCGWPRPTTIFAGPGRIGPLRCAGFLIATSSRGFAPQTTTVGDITCFMVHEWLLNLVGPGQGERSSVRMGGKDRDGAADALGGVEEVRDHRSFDDRSRRRVVHELGERLL